jgi:hypothetical protein
MIQFRNLYKKSIDKVNYCHRLYRFNYTFSFFNIKSLETSIFMIFIANCPALSSTPVRSGQELNEMAAILQGFHET